MRALSAAAALMLLSGCQDDPAPNPGDAANWSALSQGAAYRYGFALPAAQVRRAAQIHADACTRLGADRCRIAGLRYRLGDDARAYASLAVRIDPAIARSFADAVSKSITDASGTLTAFEIAAPDLRTPEDTALIHRLRDAQRGARGIGRQGTVQANRIQAALDTIADVEAEQPGIPVAFDYRSAGPLGASDSWFRNAGPTWLHASGALVPFLAAIWPWLIGLCALLLGLNWLARRRKRDHQQAPAVPVSESAPRKSPTERDNVMRRWFAPEREDGEIVHI